METRHREAKRNGGGSLLPQRANSNTNLGVYYVYILRSDQDSERFYVGSTADLKRRFREHNAGASTHTNRFGPWSLYWYAAFPSPDLAKAFETYLKTGSGRRFQKRHLGMPEEIDAV